MKSNRSNNRRVQFGVAECGTATRTQVNRSRRNRIRRTRQLRRRILFGTATLTALLVLALSCFTLRANAQTKGSVEYKYYKSIVVSSGDSILSYASQYAPEREAEGYVREVIRMNQLSDAEITAGMHLVVPYYSPEFQE